MVEKNQQMRYTRSELSAISGAFKENDELLYALRKFLWQMEMSEQEDINMKKNFDKELIYVLKKDFIAGKEYEVPLLMTHDPFVFKEVTTLAVDDLFYMSEAKLKVVEYFTKQINELETGEKNDIILNELKPKKGQAPEERYVNLYAYGVIVSVVEKALGDYKTLGNRPDELTPEEKKEKRRKDSSK